MRMFSSSYENNIKDFTLNCVLISEICTRAIGEKFVHKYSKTIQYVEN